MEIDLVIPYVNNNDPIWQKTFINYCKRRDYKRMASMRSARYQDNLGLINYQLKLVEKNMPFIRTIWLVLSNKEQMPKVSNPKVRVILHEDFIPYKFLPTFNSTTIEMFIHRIPNIAKYFIYANDDMLPIKPLTANDFFTENGKVKINFFKETFTEDDNMFKKQCWNGYCAVASQFGKKVDMNYLRPYHSMTPMNRFHCQECFDLLREQIFEKVSAFRTYEQFNQYIYPIYEHLAYRTQKSNIKFYYTKLDEEPDELIKQINENQIICPNDILNKANAEILRKELELL